MNDVLLPNLILPGFPKSGTSSLHLYLDQHPNIFMSLVKEPHIYSKPEHYKKRFEADFDCSLKAIFKGAEQATYRGESSTSYMITAISAERLKKEVPEAKFILLARDPISRIVSHYNWLKSFPDTVHLPFREELEEWDNKKFDINQSAYYGYKYYIEHSRYGAQLQHYLEFFDISQFLFLSTEALKENPARELKKCFDFLGVPALEKLELIQANETAFKAGALTSSRSSKLLAAMLPRSFKDFVRKTFFQKKLQEQAKAQKHIASPEEIAWLQDLLSEDVALFRKLTGEPFEHWKNFKKL